ncbi:complement component C9 [Oryzias latipes]|uniref:Complement component C9 n=1 Tax=Oryzias latipes TaxID=8090 RepID=H2LCR1_ORYLA|nr:complement component C9 [Oryzias latipes]
MMRIEVALQLGFCSLCLLLGFFRGGAAVEIPDPPPINCVWSRWSEWTTCDPCTKIRRRSRAIEVFGQFRGDACQGSIGESTACTTSEACVNPTAIPCSDIEFECESRKCIKKRLMCNGDYDCEDGSDEDCDPVRKPCGQTVLINNEQGRTAGYGINILGANPRMNPFNNDYFNGRCDRVRNPNKGNYDRLPWNVGVLNYETLVEETVSREIYENTHSLLKTMIQDKTFKLDAGFNVKLSPSEPSMSNLSGTIGADLGFSRQNMLKEVTEYTTIKNKSFMRVKGRVQMSTYRMRSRELQLADEFLKHVQSLPVEYEKGIYFAFLEDYGTHYTKNGKSGGEYDLVYVLNQDTIKTKQITERTLQQCIKAGITADFGVPGVDVSGHVKPEGCDNPKEITQADTDGKAVVDKVVTSVRGGNMESAVAMRGKLNKEGIMDIGTYQFWARSIADAPALLSSEPEPIYMLVPPNMPDSNARIENLKRATQDYMAEYNVCKCKPCQNGGTLALLEGKCICICPDVFEGSACQNFKPDKNKGPATRPTVDQLGNWSCWSTWSSCSGGKRSRTRFCKTDGVPGASCTGDTNSDEYC